MAEQAAIDVRRWVSADPVEDFVRELIEIVEPQSSPAYQQLPAAREIGIAANRHG